MAPESGIEGRPNLRSVKIAQRRGGIGVSNACTRFARDLRAVSVWGDTSTLNTDPNCGRLRIETIENEVTETSHVFGGIR
jgi:hypothetical protein